MQYLPSSIYQYQTSWTAIRKDTKEGERPVNFPVAKNQKIYGPFPQYSICIKIHELG